MFKKLKEQLGSYNHPFVPTAVEFMAIDVDKVAKDLRLAEKGKDRGGQNLPKSSATEPDEHEQAVTNQILAALNQAKNDYDLNLRSYNERLKSLNLDARSAEIRMESKEAISDLNVAHHSGSDELYRLRLNVLDAQKDLEDFKEQRGIRRLARYPQSKVLQFAVIVGLLLLEVILNGSVFSVGHEFGLVGGLGMAALIAFLNVIVLGLTGSYCFRFAAQPDRGTRVLGYVSTPLYLGIVAALSFLGAHLRNAISTASDDYATIALDTFVANPFAIENATSVLFVLMTSAFAIIAAFDFVKMDDPIFGYGDRDRKLRDAEEEYRSKKDDLVGVMQDIRGDRIVAMKDELAQLREDLGSHQSIVEHRGQHHSKFMDYMSYLESTANLLLARYRDANRVARTESEPESFGKLWVMNRPFIAEVGSPSDDVATVREKVEETSRILEESIGELETQFVDHIHRYNRIDELSREEVKDAQAKPAGT